MLPLSYYRVRRKTPCISNEQAKKPLLLGRLSDWHTLYYGCIIETKGVAGDGYPQILAKVAAIFARTGGYFFIAMMVYKIMIRIRTMYSISSPPPERRGKKASPLQMKGDHRQPYGNTCQYYITLLLPAQSTTQLLVYALPEPRDPQDFPALFWCLSQAAVSRWEAAEAKKAAPFGAAFWLTHSL